MEPMPTRTPNVEATVRVAALMVLVVAAGCQARLDTTARVAAL
jgi:hypothetical protein